MPTPQQKFMDEFSKQWTAYINELGKQTFDLAQKTVPYITGQLKRSGSYKPLPNGFRIHYAAPYAAKVHDGSANYPENQSQPYVAQIPTHRRKTNKGYVTVKAHTKTYQPGFKPVGGQQNEWYTADLSKPTVPKPWVQTAWKRVISKVDRDTRQYLPKQLNIKFGS